MPIPAPACPHAWQHGQPSILCPLPSILNQTTGTIPGLRLQGTTRQARETEAPEQVWIVEGWIPWQGRTAWATVVDSFIELQNH